jgi:hypothetical protein
MLGPVPDDPVDSREDTETAGATAGRDRLYRGRFATGAVLAALVVASACTSGGETDSATSSTARAERGPAPTVATTTSTSTTTASTTTTVTPPTVTPSTEDRQATASCVDLPNGYRGVPQELDDPTWTLTRRGEATLDFEGDLILDAALELWLTRTVDGVREEHHLTLQGRSVAAIAVDGDTVRILSADTSGLDRRVSSTIDAEPVATPAELVGLGDLLGRDFTMRCGTGSGGMGAETLEPSGLRWNWGINRGGRLRPPDPDA